MGNSSPSHPSLPTLVGCSGDNLNVVDLNFFAKALEKLNKLKKLNLR
jgi:hypothetical protein